MERKRLRLRSRLRQRLRLRLYDAERPVAYGQSKLMAPYYGIVPSLTWRWVSKDQYRLIVFLSVDHNRARDFNKTVHISMIPVMMKQWQECPEDCLKEWFGYEGGEP